MRAILRKAVSLHLLQLGFELSDEQGTVNLCSARASAFMDDGNVVLQPLTCYRM